MVTIGSVDFVNNTSFLLVSPLAVSFHWVPLGVVSDSRVGRGVCRVCVGTYRSSDLGFIVSYGH